jgi:hypothetical protein
VDVSSRGVRVSVASAAGAGWLILIGLTVHRVVQNHSEPWCQAASLISAVVAITASICLAILVAVPNVYEAWSQGVAYGLDHRPPEHKRGAVPEQRVRSLHSVP